MTKRIASETLLAVVEGDRGLLVQLAEAGVIPREEHGLTPEHLETARVAYTLVHDLEVNWAGVEVALHMRSELAATRRQLADLLTLLKRPPET